MAGRIRERGARLQSTRKPGTPIAMSDTRPILICTRGSALALAQANQILAHCRAAFPGLAFALEIIKTTGDKLQTASLTNPAAALPKGLFTKELEVALLDGSADLAVHSLKDLPAELPEGLMLGAVTEREDVRDVLVTRAADGCRGGIFELPNEAVIGTSSTRRGSQLLEHRSDLKVVEIRGNVGTRLRKVAESGELFGTLLAAAGLKRLGMRISDSGELEGEGIPCGLHATALETSLMLPAVGQAAIGIETRVNDARVAEICARLIHRPTLVSVIAERSFLRAFGGGCATPVAAHAQATDEMVSMEVVSYLGKGPRRARAAKAVESAIELGEELAIQVKSAPEEM